MTKIKQYIWRWLGGGGFIPGLPARDMTEQEVEERGVLGIVQQSPLYVKESLERKATKEKS